MLETLVLAVGFFCGNAPLRTLEHIAAPGVLSPLTVPAGCPQPREPLFLQLRCEKESCAGQITQGTEAGHAHAALAGIDGKPSALRIRFTNEEGLLLSKLRLSVAARRPLTAEELRVLAPVTARFTHVRVSLGERTSATFSANDTGVIGTVGAKTRPLQVRLDVEPGQRTASLIGPSGSTIARTSEGASATVSCALAEGACEGTITLSAEAAPPEELATP